MGLTFVHETGPKKPSRMQVRTWTVSGVLIGRAALLAVDCSTSPHLDVDGLDVTMPDQGSWGTALVGD